MLFAQSPTNLSGVWDGTIMYGDHKIPFQFELKQKGHARGLEVVALDFEESEQIKGSRALAGLHSEVPNSLHILGGG